jgi:surface antigen
MKDMPYGHVAVIVDVLPNAIRVAEQNFYFYYWPYNYARQIPVEFINGLYYIKDQYEVYGWMEIDDNQELIPLEQYAGKSIDIGNQRNLNSASAFHLLNIRIYFYYFLLVFLFIFYYMFC